MTLHTASSPCAFCPRVRPQPLERSTMKTARATRRAFADLPEDYAGLCREFLPRPIRTKSDYAAVVEMADAMAVHEPEFSRDQEDYFDMLCRLLEVWDREHVTCPDLTPLDLLKHLIEQHALTG